MDAISWIFLPAQFFVWHPERIAVVSLIFFACFFCMRMLKHKYMLFNNWQLFITGLLWALWAIWEVYCEAQQANIRVDLLFGRPILIGYSIFSIIVGIVNPLFVLFRKT